MCPRATSARPPERTAPLPPEAQSAVQGGLVYVSDTEPGLRRVRAGKGFRYADPDGRTVRDPEVLQRIRSLAIPPAYRDVWICRLANGHLQATGRDARGRKQYRYHPRWQEVRGAEKFDRIVAFGAALPRLRQNLRRDLARPGFAREKVLAMVVAIMADTLVRIGNDEYARGNGSYGLTTLRNRHIDFLRGGRARLHFRGKGGIEHDIVLNDARLTRLVRHCQQLPGQMLFQYLDEDGAVQPVDSGAVNDYLREAMGQDFTAKDFRTWGGTLAAMRLLAKVPVPTNGDGGPDQRALASVRKQIVCDVARTLSNTPAVCRKSYIDPVVFAAWESGQLERIGERVRGSRQWERAALRLLRQARRPVRAPRRSRVPSTPTTHARPRSAGRTQNAGRNASAKTGAAPAG